MISKEEIAEFLVWLGVVGTYVFAWGIANYRKLRAARREEDIEDARARAKLLADKVIKESMAGDDQ